MKTQDIGFGDLTTQFVKKKKQNAILGFYY